MILLKCVKGFDVEELDEPQGNHTGKNYTVKKDSLWRLETDQKFEDVSDFDELNMVDDKGEYMGYWLSNVDELTVTKNFELLVDNDV